MSVRHEYIMFAGEQLNKRSVVIHKDAKGFGLTVSGESPVFVQSVKESKSFKHFIDIGRVSNTSEPACKKQETALSALKRHVTYSSRNVVEIEIYP